MSIVVSAGRERPGKKAKSAICARVVGRFLKNFSLLAGSPAAGYLVDQDQVVTECLRGSVAVSDWPDSSRKL